jgi:hypothetical protein
MATCYIGEYSGGSPHAMAAPREPPLSEQTVEITGGSLQSAAFSGDTKMIRVNVDAACSILVGPNPTATTTNKRLAANQTEFFTVEPGHQLAVIANA